MALLLAIPNSHYPQVDHVASDYGFAEQMNGGFGIFQSNVFVLKRRLSLESAHPADEAALKLAYVLETQSSTVSRK
jgi:hypothetical protein